MNTQKHTVNLYCHHLAGRNQVHILDHHWQNTEKPVFKKHLNIQEKVSIHDRCPFPTDSLTMRKIGQRSENKSPD